MIREQRAQTMASTDQCYLGEEMEASREETERYTHLICVLRTYIYKVLEGFFFFLFFWINGKRIQTGKEETRRTSSLSKGYVMTLDSKSLLCT